MMQKVPEGIASQPGPGGTFGIRWSEIEDGDIQVWQLVRCDYPISERNASGLFSGGLDLMVTRWELHPSVTEVVEDTGVAGKHYVVLGLDSRGMAHTAPDLQVDASLTGGDALSGLSSQPGWVKGVKGKSRYDGVF